MGRRLKLSPSPPHPAAFETGFCMTLRDKFGRAITDLRISVTDRCNFRCVYCRSADPENYRDHDEILTWAELDRLARVFVGLGIRKVRVTGGEPLVRDGVEDYIGATRRDLGSRIYRSRRTGICWPSASIGSSPQACGA